MSTCTTELNKQIQGIQLRLSQAENNLSATYNGISQLVGAMMANPFTIGPASVMLPIYNLTAIGFNLQQKLVDLIPTIDMKKLMMEMAATLESTMLAELEAVTSAVLGALEGALDAATAMLDAATSALSSAVDVAADALSDVGTAEFSLDAAIAFGEDVGIAAANTALDVANTALDVANATVATATGTLASAQAVMDAFSEESLTAYGFLKGQSDAAKCKSLSLHLV